MIEDYTKLTPEEVDAELAKYREFGGLEVAPEETLADDAAKLAELQRLAEAHGFFYTLTDEDMEANPVLASEDLKSGEDVLLTAPELKELQDNVTAKAAADAEANAPVVGSACTMEDGVTAGTMQDDPANPGTLVCTVAPAPTGNAVAPAPTGSVAAPATAPAQASAPAGGTAASTAAPAVADDDTEEEVPANILEKELVYLGKTVLAVRDRLVNGKTYKEVDIPNETHTLTHEDFKAKVVARDAS